MHVPESSEERRRARPGVTGAGALRGAMLGLAAAGAVCASSAHPATGGVTSAPSARGPAAPTYSVTDCDIVHPCPGWPVWLKDYRRATRTEKTSAIAFAGRDPQGQRCFVLADEIGQLHFCRVEEPGDSGAVVLHLEEVGVGPSLLRDLPLDRPWDFEALALDVDAIRGAGRDGLQVGSWSVPDSIDGVLAVEGRGLTAEEDTRLLAVRFCSTTAATGAASRWRVESLGELIAGARFWGGAIKPDMGFKGVAISPGYFWLGLESLDERGQLHTRGSVLYLYDRAAGQVGTLPTRDWGIHTICGLAAPSDTVTVVADRNRQSLFILRWAPDVPGQLMAAFRFPLDLPAPGGFRYAIPAVEGVTVDDTHDFWCVIDPQRGDYHPVGAAPESVHVYLAAEIPMLYRFSGAAIWPATGLTGFGSSRDPQGGTE